MRTTLRAVVGVAALALALVFFNYLRSGAPVAAERPDDQASRLVTVMLVEPMPAAQRWQAFGTARPVDAATVAAEVAGQIVRMPETIEEGEPITEGDLIAKIDDEEYARLLEASRRRIEALTATLRGLDVELESLQERVVLADDAADIARAELERAERAAQQGSASPSEVDRQRSALTTALRDTQRLRESLALIPSRRANLQAQIATERASERVAELNLERTEIRAPITGTIQSVSIDAGDRVAPGTTAARIVDISRIEVPLRVPVSAAGSVETGDTVILRSTGATPQQWTGEISRIPPEADATDRTITAIAVVEQSPSARGTDLLRPGQFLQGEIIAGQRRPRLVIPRIAVRDDDTVLIIDDSSALAPRRVSIDHRVFEPERYASLAPTESEWAVLNDPATLDQAATLAPPLRPGDTLVIRGVATLRTGEKVRGRLANSGETLAAGPANTTTADEEATR